MVDLTLSRLRRKLELDPGAPRHLLTIHGEGYRLDVGEPTPPEPAEAPAVRPGTPGLLGRADALRHLADWLAGEGRWLTICGPGGVGKTALLDTLRGPGAAVPLVRVDLATRSQDEVLPTLAAALGIELHGARDPRLQVAAAVRATPMVWALDNLEHLDAAPLIRLVEACPGVRVVATSRHSVGAPAEALLRLGGLASPDAQALLRRRLGPDVPDEAVARLVALTEGLPLALEIAGAAARERPVDEVCDRIADLRDPARPDRHRSLRAVFRVSLDRLDPGHREALVRLSVFRDLIFEDDAAAVAGAGDDILDGLVDAGLLERDGRALRLHPLVRQLAAERLPRVDPSGETRRRHQAWLLHWLARIAPGLRGAEPGPLRDAVWARRRDLLAALVATDDPTRFLQIVPALRRVLPVPADHLRQADVFRVLARRFERGGHQEAALAARLLRLQVLRDLRAGEAPAPDQDLPDGGELRAWALHERAFAAVVDQRLDEGRAIAEALLAEALDADAREWAAFACCRLADARWLAGDAPEAREHAEAALHHARRTGDAALQARVAMTFAIVLQEGGHYAEARTFAEDEVIPRGRAVRDVRVEAAAMRVLVNACKALGELEASVRWAREALLRVPRGGETEALLHYNVSASLQRLGRLDEAVAALDEADALAEAIGVGRLRRDCADGRGTIAYHRGDWEEAARWFAEALRRGRDLGAPRALARIQLNLAHAHLGLGEVHLARTLARDALPELRSHAFLRPFTASFLGLVEALCGEPAAALEQLAEAVEAVEALGAPDLLGLFRTPAPCWAVADERHEVARRILAGPALPERPPGVRAWLERRLDPRPPTVREGDPDALALAVVREAARDPRAGLSPGSPRWPTGSSPDRCR